MPRLLDCSLQLCIRRLVLKKHLGDIDFRDPSASY
jgi:hypothetical protein